MMENHRKRLAAATGGFNVRSESTFGTARRLATFVLPALGLVVVSLAHAQVVKCVDAKGRVEYAKICPPGTNEAARLQRDAPPTPAAPPTLAAPPTPAAAPRPLSGSSKAGEIDPAELDNAEYSVCMAAGQVVGATAVLKDLEKDSVAIEQLAGQKSDDPRRRAAQSEMSAGIQSTQKRMVANAINDLAKYQDVYRRLTGAEFDTRLCNDNQRRIARREAWEAKRRDDQKQQWADRTVSNEGEGVRKICREKQMMDGPSKDMAVHLPADQIKHIQTEGRANYTLLVASYEKTYNKRFDSARCQ